MPELPEVEVIRRGVEPHVVGRCVRAIAGSGRKMRLPLPRKGLQQLVKGHCFTGEFFGLRVRGSSHLDSTSVGF